MRESRDQRRAQHGKDCIRQIGPQQSPIQPIVGEASFENCWHWQQEHQCYAYTECVQPTHLVLCHVGEVVERGQRCGTQDKGCKRICGYTPTL
jgi:hypothetical protein